jgi:hypothetical protein
VGELPLRLHDGETIPFQLGDLGLPGMQLLPLPDQPSEEILEGFDWERRLPGGVPDGLGRCACGAYSRPFRVSACAFHDLSPTCLVFGIGTPNPLFELGFAG